MKKFFLYLIIGIGMMMSIAFSGPLVIILLLLAWAATKLFPELKIWLDINNDGSINLDDISALLSSDRTSYDQRPIQENFLQQRMRTIWSRLEQKFVLLSIQVQKRELSARRWWGRVLPFGNDHKVSRIIENLAVELDDQELAMIRSDFMKSVTKLNNLDRQRNELRASIAMKSEPEGGPQHRAADALRDTIDSESRIRTSLLHAFQARMTAYGINLSTEQAEVLLSRIDAGDVSRMTTIFAIISSITAQFADAKVQTGENLDVTKKYYGIYLGLLELQIYIQTEYLHQMDAKYLPGVQLIGNEARDLMAKTQVKLRASEEHHQSAYRQNIKSQQFTIAVTDIYANALRADRSKVEEARKIVRKLHELAENTLSTVRVSADLSTLVRQSEGLYRQVRSLQTPALVPFENLQMQREFEAVTQRLNKS